MALLLLLEASGCADGCVNTVVERTLSPDGRLAAVLFERSCGATTAFTSQVSVVSAGAPPPTGGGSVRRADPNRGRARQGSWGGPWVDIEWFGRDQLLIRYARGARIFVAEGKVRGVRVIFRPES